MLMLLLLLLSWHSKRTAGRGCHLPRLVLGLLILGLGLLLLLMATAPPQVRLRQTRCRGWLVAEKGGALPRVLQLLPLVLLVMLMLVVVVVMLLLMMEMPFLGLCWSAPDVRRGKGALRFPRGGRRRGRVVLLELHLLCLSHKLVRVVQGTGVVPTLTQHTVVPFGASLLQQARKDVLPEMLSVIVVIVVPLLGVHCPDGPPAPRDLSTTKKKTAGKHRE